MPLLYFYQENAGWFLRGEDEPSLCLGSCNDYNVKSSTTFSNGPDDVGRWQRATFKFFLHIQGTSIGLVRTNHALLSLVDTNLA